MIHSALASSTSSGFTHMFPGAARGQTHNGAASRLLHTPARTGAHPGPHASPPTRKVRRPEATSPAGGPRRPGHSGAPAGGRGGRRGRGHREQHPRRGAAASRPAHAQARRPAARPRPPAAGGAGGGGSGAAQARDPARGRAGPRATPTARARRGAPRGAGARLRPQRRPRLRATSVSAAPGPRGLCALTLRVGAARARGEAQLLAARTLQTLRMNDDSAAHSQRAPVAPVFWGAGLPRALRAGTCRCGWLWGNLRGPVWQALGPTPIPAGRTPPAS